MKLKNDISDPQQLIQRFCETSDHNAFNDFYRQQADRLWRFLVARGCDHDTAYDILSEAFLRFTQTVCKDLSSPVALLFRIAINLHIDHYRHEKVVQTAALDYLKNNQEYQYVESDSGEVIRRLISTLENTEQNLLLMRYWIGLTHKEVAQALDIPEGTVRRQSAELLRKLAETWKEELYDIQEIF